LVSVLSGKIVQGKEVDFWHDQKEKKKQFLGVWKQHMLKIFSLQPSSMD
jgi:hypothetical protein